MLEKKPFTNYTLDEDRDDSGRETINISLNKAEREELDVVKWLLHENKDGTAMKYCLELAKNELHGQFSEDSWRKICSETRRKETMKRPECLSKT